LIALAGRGFGKTRSGAECVRDQVMRFAGTFITPKEKASAG
jgi:hypothetical protein